MAVAAEGATGHGHRLRHGALTAAHGSPCGLPQVILTPDGGVTLKAVGNTATVVEPDLKVGQAVVHVIDAVLLPFAPPVATPEATPGVEAQPVSGAASTVASLAALAASVLAAVLMM